MSALLMVIPWYYRALAIALLVAAAMGWAWVKGVDHEQVKFDAYKHEIETAAAAQIVKYKQVAQAGAEISKQNGAEYEQNLHNLAALYADERMRNASRSGKASPVSSAARVANARPADAVPSAGNNATECETLKADAAATTLQFLWLRNWIKAQQVAWDS